MLMDLTAASLPIGGFSVANAASRSLSALEQPVQEMINKIANIFMCNLTPSRPQKRGVGGGSRFCVVGGQVEILP